MAKEKSVIFMNGKSYEFEDTEKIKTAKLIADAKKKEAEEQKKSDVKFWCS